MTTEKDSVPVVAWLVEFGAVSLPEGHPSRLTSLQAFEREVDARQEAEAIDYDSRVDAVVRQADHLAALASLKERCDAAERLLRAASQDWHDNASLMDCHQEWGEVWSEIDAHLAAIEQEQPNAN